MKPKAFKNGTVCPVLLRWCHFNYFFKIAVQKNCVFFKVRVYSDSLGVNSVPKLYSRHSLQQQTLLETVSCFVSGT